MVLLGWVVGKGSTGVDNWFHRFERSGVATVLADFANPLSLAVVTLAIVAVALYQRRWRLAAVAAVFPPAAYLLVQVLKPLFGRHKGGGLAYPSGHITLTTVVMGLLVIATGGALWAMLTAVGYVALAIVGVGATYHYFTDTVGGVLLGTAIVCVASLISGQRAHRT